METKKSTERLSEEFYSDGFVELSDIKEHSKKTLLGTLEEYDSEPKGLSALFGGLL